MSLIVNVPNDSENPTVAPVLNVPFITSPLPSGIAPEAPKISVLVALIVVVPVYEFAPETVHVPLFTQSPPSTEIAPLTEPP